ncbi:hypothetical protein [Rhizobium sp. GCM10022189]|uniref:hypothetical protein n=1 Tax=Rhizobium sp. GCM10022189 TaxID=3252654 RepID=UPI00360C2340
MDQTPNFNIPMPDADADPSRTVSEEFLRLAAAWLIVDALLKAQADGIAGKANTNHTHQINEISGLASALAAKLDANVQFSLDDLSDVDGASSAALNYVLVKGINGIWRASSAIAALGPHQHQRSDIAGLDNYIDGRFSALIGGAPDALNAINELAAAIGNDPNFAVSVSQQVADVKALVPDYFGGFVPAYVSTTTFSVSAGAGIFGGKKHSTAVATGCSLAAIFGTGNGCLDTGAIQANKSYFVYAIRNLSNGATAFIASRSATEGGVAIPSGWELLSGSRVGIILTNGSGQIMPFVQRGNRVVMPDVLWLSSSTDLTTLATTTTIPNGLSVDVAVYLTVQIATTGADAFCIVGDADAANALVASPSPSYRVACRARTGNDYPDSSLAAGLARSNDLGQVYIVIDHSTTAAASAIYVNGWHDYQCKRLFA